jgi:phosphohistidine phosphatase
MKTLHLIRHAKSSWGTPSLSDVERPLNNRGREACKLMAERMVEVGCTFESVYCSIATRAQLTIEGLSQALPDLDISWKLDTALYTFSSQDLLDYCTHLDDTLDDVVLVGHNPAMTGFSNGMGDQYLENLPTCGYVQIEIPAASWSELSPNTGKTKAILTPKMFKQS